MADNLSIHNPSNASAANDNPKSQTSRISLDSARSPIKSALEAKKATGPVPGIPTHAGPIPQTIRLKRPPTSPVTIRPDLPSPAKKPVDTGFAQAHTVERSATAETVKRQTSRIVLTDPAATKTVAEMKRSTGPVPGIPTHAGPIPQTIRLKRPPTAPIVMPPSINAAGHAPKANVQPLSEAPTIIKHLVTSKAPTSRIVLEDSGISPSSEMAKHSTSRIPPISPLEHPAPKTIRLKRPSSTGDSEEAAPIADIDANMQTAKKGETAKIVLPIDNPALTPITQRKTIKIKRSDHATPPRSAAAPERPVAEEPVIETEPVATKEMTATEEEDQTLVFPIVAAAAALCIAALVYIMVAQAFGMQLPLPSSMQLH